MARLWQFGAEQNTNTAGVEITVATNSGNILSTSPVRSGTYAHKTQGNAGVQENGTYKFVSSASNGPYYARAYIYIPASISVICSIFSFYDGVSTIGSTFGRIRLATNNTLELWDSAGKIGSSSPVLNTNEWYLIELKYYNNTGTGKLELDARYAPDNGSASVSFASTTTSTNVAGVTFLAWGNNSAGTATIDVSFDDLAINDSTGSFQTSFPGPGKIINLKPNAAGDINGFLAQVGGTAGSANNYTRVNEVTPDDATSYNGSAVLNAEDLFNVDDSGIGTSDTVNVVAVGVRMADLVGADATAAFKLEIEKTSGGTKTQSGTIIPNSTAWITNAAANPRNYPLVTYQDPDGANWTKTTLDSMQIGYIQTAINLQTIAISTLWASIDYNPAVPTTSTSSSTTTTSTSTTSTSSSTSTTTSTSSSSSTSTTRTTSSTSTTTTSTSTTSTSSSTTTSSSSSTSTTITTPMEIYVDKPSQQTPSDDNRSWSLDIE